jgi:hypothetical protein
VACRRLGLNRWLDQLAALGPRRPRRLAAVHDDAQRARSGGARGLH